MTTFWPFAVDITAGLASSAGMPSRLATALITAHSAG